MENIYNICLNIYNICSIENYIYYTIWSWLLEKEKNRTGKKTHRTVSNQEFVWMVELQIILFSSGFLYFLNYLNNEHLNFKTSKAQIFVTIPDT